MNSGPRNAPWGLVVIAGVAMLACGKARLDPAEPPGAARSANQAEWVDT